MLVFYILFIFCFLLPCFYLGLKVAKIHWRSLWEVMLQSLKYRFS